MDLHAYLEPLKDINPFKYLQENPSASYFVPLGKADFSPITITDL